jgi:hypothetical protein
MNERRTVGSKTVPEGLVRLVGVLAGCDVRTSRKFLEGGAIKGYALRERLADAMKRAEKMSETPGAVPGASGTA